MDPSGSARTGGAPRAPRQGEERGGGASRRPPCGRVLLLPEHGRLRPGSSGDEAAQRQIRGVEAGGPSCRYGGESLTPRSGNVLIGPSAYAIIPLTRCDLKNRSVWRLCMRLSV